VEGGGERPVVQDTRGASLTSPHLCTAEGQLHGGQQVGARTEKRGQLAELGGNFRPLKGTLLSSVAALP